MQTVTLSTKNRYFSEILKILSMFRKRIGRQQAMDCNPEKHLHNCAAIVLGGKAPHFKIL